MYIYGILSKDTLFLYCSYHPMNNHGVNNRSVLFEDFFWGQAEMPVHIQLCLTVANVGAGTSY